MMLAMTASLRGHLDQKVAAKCYEVDNKVSFSFQALVWLGGTSKLRAYLVFNINSWSPHSWMENHVPCACINIGSSTTWPH
jgi:hypothetical protein